MSATTTRRPLPALVFLLVLTVLTAVVWWRVLHRPDSSSATSPVSTSPITCTPGAKTIALPKPAAVTVTVLNGANRNQLASQVTALLKARGFTVGKPLDAPSQFSGTGQIQFGSTGRAGATLLSYYLPGASMVADKRLGTAVTLVLGSGYQALASAADVSKAVANAKKPC